MEVASNFDDFLQTSRTGRRNAIPDIESEKNKVLASGDLPLQFDKINLTCSDSSGMSSINQFNNSSIATTSNHNQFN